MSLKRLLAALLFLGLVSGPQLWAVAQSSQAERAVTGGRWGASGQAPDPAATPEAVVQVYAARTVGLKGAFGVHPWIVVKPEGAPAYARYEVVGWGVRSGARSVRLNMRPPDANWAGRRPTLLVEHRGEAAARMIPRILEAIEAYPYPDLYAVWPGPNSNTFVAWVARQVPALQLEMPALAIGKDFLPGAIAATAPSGTGVQVNLFGLLGMTLALREGIELNLLGLTLGIDPESLGIKLPGVGDLALR
ncbi:DUF3750 domain-containing protein [Marinivivus vitaminiproducens]|uniref:DUF3750 domain-containing protein n=1 Tax=Marinivivus vitaminiproducens TaxID=3035935 RepID=UPI00279CAE9C|nr:DUF3750 domain-containing protein [Geminicoccaceae bacterium SCSIO 64248]